MSSHTPNAMCCICTEVFTDPQVPSRQHTTAILSFLITQPSVSTSIYYPGMTIEIVNTSTMGQGRGLWILELHCPPPPLNFIYVCYMSIKLPLSCWRRVPQQSMLSPQLLMRRTSPSRTWSHGRRLERPWRCATNFSREICIRELNPQ